MSTVTATEDRGAGRAPVSRPGETAPPLLAPVHRLTVLYDAECSHCVFVRDWLVRQPQLVPLELVPAGSPQARRRFPGLDHRATLDEVTVVGDAGQVYREAAAWIVTLWALREHRPLAHRLSTPAGARLARGAVLAAAKWRGAQRDEGAQGNKWGRRKKGDPGRGEDQWGGRVYRRVDGWAYDPGEGWTYHLPAHPDHNPSGRHHDPDHNPPGPSPSPSPSPGPGPSPSPSGDHNPPGRGSGTRPTR
ncbi:putative DCC family thiol-disulfide oxidoreductase YuxK [Streptomyces sp. LBL]|nr:putative DCC family thiol-disulfide oxidoreductase YuxK [Streptomyces sp. LBL]